MATLSANGAPDDGPSAAPPLGGGVAPGSPEGPSAKAVRTAPASGGSAAGKLFTWVWSSQVASVKS